MVRPVSSSVSRDAQCITPASPRSSGLDEPRGGSPELQLSRRASGTGISRCRRMISGGRSAVRTHTYGSLGASGRSAHSRITTASRAARSTTSYAYGSLTVPSA